MKRGEIMDCKKVNQLLLNCSEGSLSPDINEQVEKHIKECEFCQKNLTLTSLENLMLKDTSDIPELSGQFTYSIINQIKNFQNTKANTDIITSQNKKLPLYAVSVLAACFIFVLLVCGMNGHHLIPFQNIAINKNASVKQQDSGERNFKLAKTETDKIHYDKIHYIKKDNSFSSNNELSPNDKSDSPVIAENNEKDSEINTSVEKKSALKTSSALQNIIVPDFKLTGLPNYYILQKVNPINENSIQYIYINNNNQQNVTITVAITDETVSLDKSFSAASADINNTESLVISNTDTDSASVTKTLDNKIYHISIAGSITAEELSHLTANIQIED